VDIWGSSALHSAPIGSPNPAVLPLHQSIVLSARHGVHDATATSRHLRLPLLPCLWLQTAAAGFHDVCTSKVQARIPTRQLSWLWAAGQRGVGWKAQGWRP
jgi:hypothetical protein